MRAFATHFMFDFRLGLRDKSMLFINYLFPLGFYIMMGLVMTKINPLFAENMIPSMTVFAILASTALGMPNPLVAARESGIFRSYKINGVPAVSILAIPFVATIFHSTILAIIILITAPTVFGGKSVENVGGFILVFYAIAFAGAGLGLLIGTISKNIRVTVLWSQLIFLPSMLLGGLMIPTNTLPGSIARVSRILPSTYAMNAFQSLSFAGESIFSPLWSVIILFAGGALSFIVSTYLFKWDNHNNSKAKNSLLALIALFPYVLGAIFL
jgi:ABC-2 type transport system permease protein